LRAGLKGRSGRDYKNSRKHVRKVEGIVEPTSVDEELDCAKKQVVRSKVIRPFFGMGLD
jgi:hypothetical protein